MRNLLIAALLSATVDPAAVLTIDPSASNVSVGDTVTLNVDITGVSDLFAYQFDLTFDPTILSAVSVSNGLFLSMPSDGSFIPGTIDNVGGGVSATADFIFGPGPGVTGDGTLAIFQFTAIGSGTSAISTPLGSVILLDSGLNDIAFTTSDGSVSVAGGSSNVPEPSSRLFMGVGLLILPIVRLLSSGLLPFRPSRLHCG